MRIAVALALVAGLVVSAAAKPGKPAKNAPKPTAFVIVLDRSGSMQGAKLEAAKKAVLSAAKALAGSDKFAFVTFDSEANVVVPTTNANDKSIATQVAQVKAGGGTNIYPGLVKAQQELGNVIAKKKVVLLLSDGEAPADGIADLVKAMRADGIVVSTVAVQGADEAMLKMISDEGAGRAYKIGDDLSKISVAFVDEVKIARK
jgi:Ca-activated chloride channel family protein